MRIVDAATRPSKFAHVRRIGLAGLVILTIFNVDGVSARAGATARDTIVIRNDRGGNLKEKSRQIRKILRSGARVEIRGKVCLSACTMYLGVPGVCVEAETIFGFHGPSSRLYGVALRNEQFEHWSNVMARHYPEPIRLWFLKTARHRIVGVHEVPGSKIIELGIARCKN